MNDHYQDDEIRLIDLIQYAKNYFWEAVRFWWLILILALLVAGFSYYTISQKSGFYTANLTFMLNSNEVGSNSPISGFMGQFGLRGGGNTNLSKMGELMTSRKIIIKTLFMETEMEVDGNKKTDYFANHYITTFKLEDEWKEAENEKLYGFRFKHANIDSFSVRENSIANSIFRRIVSYSIDGDLNEAHLGSNFNETETEIVRLYFKSTSQEYSKLFLNKLFDVLGGYYVEKSVDKQRETLRLVQHRTDSLKARLLSKERQLANFRDANKGIFKAKSQLTSSELARDIQSLGSMYFESIRNLESARMTLQVKTPYVQVIDRPVYPLSYRKEHYRSGTIKGFIIGGVFMTLLIFVRKFFLDILKNEREEEEE